MGRLQGNAYTILQDTNYLQVEPLLRRLKRIFGPNKTLNQYRGELGNAYMRHNETMLDYISRIKEIQTAITSCETEQKGPLDSWTTNGIEQDVLDSCVNGLPSELLIRLKIDGYDDLDDAFARAVQLSKTLETELQRRRPAFKQPPAKLPRHDPPQPQAIQQQGVPFTRPLVPGRPGLSAPRVPICYYCKIPGHVMSECRKRAYNAQQMTRVTQGTTAPATLNKQSGNDGRAPTETGVRRDTGGTGRQVTTVSVEETTQDRASQS